MISFIVALVLLVVGYVVYGAIVERVFGMDAQRQTPAIANADGVDYVPMSWWRIFLIQFLNIAGLGPIFGAIMGVMFGPAAFLWIVFGTIFGGAVHDYVSGMMSVRSNGASLPEIVGDQLGKNIKTFMRVFSLLLMILVGAVFVSGPAGLLARLTPEFMDVKFWIIVVFAYYILATLLPIDKLIGMIYPLFGAALLFMAVGILYSLFRENAPIPEVFDGIANRDPKGLPIFPMMFVSIACGAISGFHATQSPLMARCIKNERYGRRIFYGAMVAEGVVALIWAAAASSYWGSLDGLQEFVASLPATANKPAEVVDVISRGWLGSVGSVLAMLGVIAAPITSGDTALRSARLIAADFLHIEQKSIKKRLMVSVPLFLLTYLVLQMDFDVLWRYFAWSNQTLAVFTLWAATVYLCRNHRNYWITIIPAIFMTAVSVCYIVVAPEGLALPIIYGYVSCIVVCVALVALFFVKKKNYRIKE